MSFWARFTLQQYGYGLSNFQTHPKEFINNYFEKKNIEIEDVTFEVQIIENERIYRNTFTIDLPRLLTYADVIDDLSMYPNIREVRLVAVND